MTSSDVPEVLDTGLHEDALNHLHENEENESNDEGENEELNFQAPPHGEFGEDTGEGQRKQVTMRSWPTVMTKKCGRHFCQTSTHE